ncbi:MAG: tRNA (cytidine(34)-2'-O)-methyltransferase [Pseudomonadota bacterium]
MPELVLFQPDIPGNTGTLLRLGACLNTKVHIIEPAGFRLDEKAFRRAQMDYRDQAMMQRHLTWEQFEAWRNKSNRRLVLLTTKASTRYTEFKFESDDLLLLGRESSGAPQYVHDSVGAAIKIPMQPDVRSLNMAISGAIVLSEAMRQTNSFPVL